MAWCAFILLLLLHVGNTEITWCTTYSTLKVQQNMSCHDIGTQASKAIDIVSMRAEYEHSQILLKTDGTTWPSVALSYSLSSSSGSFSGSLAFTQVGYVNCTKTPRYHPSGGGWRPDPLLPLGANNTFSLQPGVTQPIWLRLWTPATAKPGEYTGTVSVAVHGNSAIHIPIKVQVVSRTVPPLSKATWGYAFSFTEGPLEQFYGTITPTIRKAWYSYLAERRTYADSLYHPKPRPIDQYEVLASEGAQWFNMLEVNIKSDPQTVIGYLEPIMKELEQKGIQDKAYVYGFDENPRSAEPKIREIYGALKKKWPNLRTVATLNWKSYPSDLPVDVLVHQYEYYNATQAKEWRKAGHKLYLYHCIEPSGSGFLNTFIERPGIQARLLYWLGALDEVDGWLYYAMDLWNPKPPSKHTIIKKIKGTAQTNFPPANYIWLPRTDIWANGDGQFLYPGANGKPVGSLRLDIMGDGLEDVELWNTLSTESKKPLLEKLVRGPTDFTSDPCLLEQIRRKALNIHMTCP